MKNNDSFSQYDTMSLETQRNEEISLLERHDLLTGEPRYIEDEIRNSKIAMYCGAIAGVACLVGLILAWIFYNRDRKGITLWLAIFMTLGMFAGFVIAAWGAGTGSKIRLGHTADTGFTLAAFLLALIFAVYFAVAAVYFRIYRFVHFCRLTNWKSDTDEWNSHMPDSWDLQKGIFRDNRLIWWIVAICAIACLLFAISAYAIWSCTGNRYKFAGYALGLASFGLVMFGFFLIYWVKEAQEWSEFPANEGQFLSWPLTFMKWLAIGGIVLGFLSLVARILNKSTIHFLLGFIALIMILLTVLSVGLVLRNVYESQTNGKYDSECSANMAPIHEDDLGDWCPNKYLATGRTCRKNDATFRWESDEVPHPQATLNPSCCFCIKNYYTWPYQMVGFFGIFFLICLIIVAMTNFYLSDNRDTYGLSTAADPIDYAFLGLCFLAALIALLYFWLRDGDRSSGNNNASFRAFNDKSVRDPNFDRVHSRLKSSSTGASIPQGTFVFNSENNPTATYDPSNSVCGDGDNCLTRLAVLSRAGSVSAGNTFGTVEGEARTRLAFFPGCTATNHGYIMYYGQTDQIASLMKELQISASGNSNPDVLYYVDQVKDTDFQSGGGGLVNGENPSTAMGAADTNCGDGFNTPTSLSTCAGECKYAYNHQLQTTTLKGQLYYIEGADKKTDIHSGVSVAAYDGDTQVGSGNLYSTGIFTIPNIPINPDTDTIYQVRVQDQDNIFLDDDFDAVVPKSADTETSAGHKRLLTKDGEVCNLTNDPDCVNNQEYKQGTIKVHVINSETGADVEGATVDLIGNQSFTGTVSQTGTTGADGYATFENLNYGYYDAKVQGTGLNLGVVEIDLNSELTDKKVSVSPVDTEFDMIQQMHVDDPTADFDLKMYARNPSNYECEVSPMNKYCAYSQHYKDNQLGETSQEIIKVKDFAVAKYKTTIEPAPNYGTTCPEYQLLADHTTSTNADSRSAIVSNPVSGGWNWETFRTTNPLDKNPLYVNTNYKSGVTSPTDQQLVIAYLGVPPNVETKTGAQVPKTLLNEAGTPVTDGAEASTYIEPTNPALSEVEIPQGEDSGDLAINAPLDDPPTSMSPISSTDVKADTPDQEEAPEGSDAAPIDTPVKEANRILQGDSSTGPSSILVNCFTGYGKSSLVTKNVYLYTDAQLADWTLCDNSISADYTLTKLKTANDQLNR